MAVQKFVKTTVAALFIAGIFITFTTLAVLTASQTIPLNGTLTTVNVEAYSDSACTQPIVTLNYGPVDPGSIVTQMLYIKNSGSVPVTLSIVNSSWIPVEAGYYLDLSWNRQDYVLDAGLSIQAIQTLTVASNSDSLSHLVVIQPYLVFNSIC